MFNTGVEEYVDVMLDNNYWIIVQIHGMYYCVCGKHVRGTQIHHQFTQVQVSLTGLPS